jgi:hypothetical protein
MRLALLLFLLGCGSGDSSQDGCHGDGDCPVGRCVASACVTLSAPLDAAVADLAPLHD